MAGRGELIEEAWRANHQVPPGLRRERASAFQCHHAGAAAPVALDVERDRLAKRQEAQAL